MSLNGFLDAPAVVVGNTGTRSGEYLRFSMSSSDTPQLSTYRAVYCTHTNILTPTYVERLQNYRGTYVPNIRTYVCQAMYPF